MNYEGIEFKDGDLVRYEPLYWLAAPLTGRIIGSERTRSGIRYAIMDDEGETYTIYDYKGEITLLSPAERNFPQDSRSDHRRRQNPIFNEREMHVHRRR